MTTTKQADLRETINRAEGKTATVHVVSKDAAGQSFDATLTGTITAIWDFPADEHGPASYSFTVETGPDEGMIVSLHEVADFQAAA